MTARRLGRTGVRVSALGFGGAPLGNLYAPLDDDQARAAVDAAWDVGVRYYDTAPHYGLGLSERRLGAALAHRPRADDASFDYGPASDALLRRARRLADVCARHGTVLPHAAVRFPLRDPAVACVVAGFRAAHEVTSAARWAGSDLTDDTWSDLDAVAEATEDEPRR